MEYIEIHSFSFWFGFIFGVLTIISGWGIYFFTRVHNSDDEDGMI